MKLDEKLAQALTNLRSNADFRTFVDAMHAMTVEELNKVLSQVEPIHIGRQQGRTLVLQEINKMIADAPTVLDKLKPK